jgi:TatD DNase family protein
MKIPFVDIHSHTVEISSPNTRIVNLFPDALNKLESEGYFSVGLHPWYIGNEGWRSDFESLSQAAASTKVLAVGETGLDKSTQTPYELQKEVFSAHVALAKSLRKPLIIHCVRAYSDLLSARKNSDLSIPWIFHWFNTDEHIARELIRMNCYLSFGHMLFKESSRAFSTFHHVPLNRTFFETDDAGISIEDIYRRAASIRKLDLEELKSTILNNFNRCFQF